MSLQRDLLGVFSALRRSGPKGAVKASIDLLLWRIHPARRAIAKQEQEQIARDRAWDTKHYVTTSGEVLLNQVGLSSHQAASGNDVYRPVHTALFVTALQKLKIKQDAYTFIDYGSGKGKALLLASEFPFKNILGIEYAEPLHLVAAANIASYRSPTQSCREIRSIWADATTFEPPLEPLVCFFFNPFGAEVLTLVLKTLHQSWSRLRRPLFLVYVNHRDVNEKLPVFARQEALRTVLIEQHLAIFEFA